MPIDATYGNELWCFDTENDNSFTTDVDMPAVGNFAIAEISLSQIGTSGGIMDCGIRQVRFIDDSGVATSSDFADQPYHNLPTQTFAPRMIGLTFEVAVFSAFAKANFEVFVLEFSPVRTDCENR